jgi:hypothetical protein
MTNQGDDHVLSVARSWNNPPLLRLEGGTWESEGYDYTQRAYMINGNSAEGDLEFVLEANEKSPVHNPAVVVNDWQGGKASLFIDGEEVQVGKSFRQGIEYEVDGSTRLIIWVRKQSDKPVTFKLHSL